MLYYHSGAQRCPYGSKICLGGWIQELIILNGLKCDNVASSCKQRHHAPTLF
ncbi:hypothetical protein LINPERPRIM_LOCUS28139 [Linum perenne]